MPAFARSGGEWVESVPRVRANSAWSGDNDEFNSRLAGAWELIWPYGDSTLIPPTNLLASASDDAVTITWTDPSQNVTPTHTQVRIPEITPVWTEFIYGTVSAAFSALDPSTEYQAQVRYVKRSETTGQVELTSATTTKFFTTQALSGPGTPAPDPGGSGPDAVIPWGDTVGTPGPVDSEFCWWIYTIQEFDPDTYIWSDSSLIANVEVAGDIGELTYDFTAEGFPCPSTLRWKYAEVCDGVQGDWEYASAFMTYCDYEDPCGGISQTTVFSNTPWTDAIFAMPKICYEDFKTKIEDFVVADVEYGRLPAFLAPLYLNGAWNLVARDDVPINGAPLAAGAVPALVPLGSSVPSLTSDCSVAMSVRLNTQPADGGATPLTLMSIGDTIRIVAYAEGAGFTISAFIPKQGGGMFELVDTTELALDEQHRIVVTIDQDGDKLLYLDGELAVTDTDSTRADFSNFTNSVKTYANANMSLRNVGAWDRVLDASEVLVIDGVPMFRAAGDFVSGSTTSINGDLPTYVAGDLLIAHHVVHSEAALPDLADMSMDGWEEIVALDDMFTRVVTKIYTKFASASEATPVATCSSMPYAGSFTDVVQHLVITSWQNASEAVEIGWSLWRNSSINTPNHNTDGAGSGNSGGILLSTVAKNQILALFVSASDDNNLSMGSPMTQIYGGTSYEQAALELGSSVGAGYLDCPDPVTDIGPWPYVLNSNSTSADNSFAVGVRIS